MGQPSGTKTPAEHARHEQAVHTAHARIGTATSGTLGGYMATNPNVFNGFERNLSGVWNVGVMVRVPVWNWMEHRIK